MNKYIVNIYGDQNIEIIADKVKTDGPNLHFYMSETFVAEFVKWQYWKLEGEFIPPSVPRRIKF